MRRILSAFALTFLLLVGWSNPSDAATAECVGQITGPGSAEVTGDCLLLAYAYSPTAMTIGSFPESLPQTLFHSVRGTGTLTVALPPCGWQVDLVDGDAVVVETLTEEYYGPNGWLVDYEHGGSLCETTTTTTTTTSTTVPSTTTTVPQTSTTGTVPSTTVTIQSNPPTQQLARTGVEKYDNLLTVVIGLMIAGGALVWLGEDARRKT